MSLCAKWYQMEAYEFRAGGSTTATTATAIADFRLFALYVIVITQDEYDILVIT